MVLYIGNSNHRRCAGKVPATWGRNRLGKKYFIISFTFQLYFTLYLRSIGWEKFSQHDPESKKDSSHTTCQSDSWTTGTCPSAGDRNVRNVFFPFPWKTWDTKMICLIFHISLCVLLTITNKANPELW